MEHVYHMNVVRSHPLVRATVRLAASPLVLSSSLDTGTTVQGTLEVESDGGSGLQLGELMVDLVGLEEVSHPKATSRRVLVHEVNTFQGPGLPPSNICSAPALSSSPQGFFPARTGRCSFPLSFVLPASATLPSSLALPGASVRYLIRAHVGVLHDGKRVMLVQTQEVELVRPAREGAWKGASEGSWEGRLQGGGKVRLGLEGERLAVAGRKCLVSLVVANGSQRKLITPKLSFVRSLCLPCSPSSPPLAIDSIPVATLRDECYQFAPGAFCTVHVEVDVPEQVRSVVVDDGPGEEKGLFEVRLELVAQLETGVVGESVSISMPLFVAHPAALPAGHQLKPSQPQLAAPGSHWNPSRTPSPSPYPMSSSPFVRPHSVVYQAPYGPSPPSRVPFLQGYDVVQQPQRSMSVPVVVGPTSYPLIQPSPHQLAGSGHPSVYTPPAQPHWPRPTPLPAHHQQWSAPPAPEWQIAPSVVPIARPASAHWAPAPIAPASSWHPSARPASALGYVQAAPATNSTQWPPFGSGGAVAPHPQQAGPPARSASAMTHHHLPPAHSPSEPLYSQPPAAARVSHHLRESSVKAGRGRSVSPQRSVPTGPYFLPVDSNLLRQAPAPSLSPAFGTPPGFVPYAADPAPAAERRPVLSPHAHRLSRIDASTPGGEFSDVGSLADDLAALACSPPDEWNKTLPAPPVPTGKKRSAGVKAVQPALLAAFGVDQLRTLAVTQPAEKLIAEVDRAIVPVDPALSSPVSVQPPPRSPTMAPASPRPGREAPASASPPSTPAFCTTIPIVDCQKVYTHPARIVLQERERLRAVKGARVQDWLMDDPRSAHSPLSKPVVQPSRPKTGSPAPSPVAEVSSPLPTQDASTRAAKAAPATFRSSDQVTSRSPPTTPIVASTKSLLSGYFLSRSPEATPAPCARSGAVVESALDPLVAVPAKFASRIARSQLQLEEAYKKDQLARKDSTGSGLGSARGGKGGKVADVTKLWSSAEGEKEPSPPAQEPTPPNPVKATAARTFLNTSSTPKAALSSTASLVASSVARTTSNAQPHKDQSVVSGTLAKNFSKDRLRQLREKYGG